MKIPYSSPFKILLLLLSIAAVFSFSSPSIAGAESLVSALKAQNEQYMTAYRAGDVAGVTALHTKNGTVIAPNSERAVGLDAIQKFLDGEMGLGPGEIEIKTIEVVSLNNDTAYETGNYNLTINVTDGIPIIDEGDYVVIWKFGSDNIWRMHVDIWNTRLPLQ